MSESYDGPAIADALARARHRIRQDEALLRQALGALTDPYTWDTEAAIAALRERLGESK